MSEKQKILIIDDDDRNIFALKAVLTARGYNCLSAVSGLQALTLLHAQPDISVALVDMMMPDIDGYTLMETLKRTAALCHIRLVAVTAQAMAGDREKCLGAGADAYISKPVDVDQLLHELNKPLKQS
jgi:two-component system cell cycle response regulator DivK